MSRINRFVRSPLLHCLLLGAAGFFIWVRMFPPVLGTVMAPGPEQLQQLRSDWMRQMGRAPDSQETALIRQSVIDDNIAVAEALRRGMHEDDALIARRLLLDAEFLGMEGEPDDLIRQALDMGFASNDVMIRRRLLQRMDAMASGIVDGAAAPVEALHTLYEDNAALWMTPARVSFKHRFFSIDKPQDPVARARTALEDGAISGDPFLHGLDMPLMTQRSIASTFGHSFSEAIVQRSELLNAWQGPVASSYGQHLVYIREFEPSRKRSYDEVESELRRLWVRQEKQRRVQAFRETLRSRYRVVGGGPG